MTSANQLRTMGRIVNELRAIEMDLPASYAAVLIYTARHKAERGEDPNSADVSDHTGIARPSMSRILRSMSDARMGKTRVGEERPSGSRQSLKLLEKTHDPVDLRMIRLRLTPKGAALLRRIGDSLDTYAALELNNGN
jgi:DNA-binding MarR family transcriptional regulator